MSRKVEEDILKYAEKIADLIMTVKSDETVMRDKEKEADSIMTVKSEETVMTDKEKEADLTMTVKSDETVMEDKEKEGYHNIKKRRYSSYGLEVYPAHPQLMISAPEKSTNTGRKLLEPEQKKDEEGRMMSYKVGATQAEEDISKNAEKIVDSYQNMKSEETVTEDKEKKVDPFLTMNFDEKVYSPHLEVVFCPPEESTDSDGELLEPEPRKDEEGKMWYNVIFCPGIRIPEQMLLLKDNLTGDIYNFLPNIEDESIMEVFMTKEDAATFAGLEEVLSVEPFLGVHKYHLLKPPGPEVGYCTGVLSLDPFVYF